jgi:Protein tyrosine/serine phosphatase
MEGDSETRTTLDKDYTTVLWMPTESISVFRGGGMARFTSDNKEKSKSASFKGTLPGSDDGSRLLYGLYPYSADATVSKDVITTSLPAEQKGFAGSFADGLFLSVSQTTTYEMGFRNVCSGIRFMLDRDDIRTVTLLSNGGEPLAGRVSVSFDKSGDPFVADVAEAASEVRLTAPDGKTFKEGEWYYLVTLPADLGKGYTLILEGDEVQGCVRSSNAISLNRNKFRSAKLDASRVDYKKPGAYDIENAGVRAYLEQVDYTNDPDYNQSYVSNYSGSDKPNPVKLSWDGKAASVRISASPDLSGYKEIKVDASPASVYNLIPGVRYFYSVVAADGSVLRESCVIPKGPMRMINGVTKNMRDLGGWKAADGRTIRYGKLYRGARVDDIQSNPTAKEIFLNELGVDIDLDLRGLPPGSQGGSAEKNPWTSNDPIQYVNIQLWHYFHHQAVQYPVPEISEGESADIYQSTIRTIIGWLKEDKVVYFHCHGGSDRTGTLAFLIEGLLGVSEEDLSKDYEVTYYSGSNRKRNSSSGWFYKPMIRYIRTFAPGGTITDQVTAWAKTRHSENVDPLTDDEIQLLKDLMID